MPSWNAIDLKFYPKIEEYSRQLWVNFWLISIVGLRIIIIVVKLESKHNYTKIWIFLFNLFLGLYHFIGWSWKFYPELPRILFYFGVKFQFNPTIELKIIVIIVKLDNRHNYARIQFFLFKSFLYGIKVGIVIHHSWSPWIVSKWAQSTNTCHINVSVLESSERFYHYHRTFLVIYW